MKFDSRLKQANSRLKTAQVKARIYQKGSKLYLVATLPARPGAARSDSHQQYLALGVQANITGLQNAEMQARKVSALLDCKEFSWQGYLKAELPDNVASKIIECMREEYFNIRGTNEKTLQTWKTEYQAVLSKLSPDKPFSVESLKDILLLTKANTRSRKRYAIALSALARFTGLPDKSLKDLQGTYSLKSVALRALPSDQLIADTFKSLSFNAEWQWLFGAIATYGLRPHEAFHLDLTQFPVAIVISGKTGRRHVRPIYPEWADIWGLKDSKIPNCNGSNVELGNRVSHAFKRYSIPFKAYDLRHRWAVRSLEFNYDISLAAKELGHSVEVHSQIYHAAISQEVHDQAFKKLLNNPNRPKPPI